MPDYLLDTGILIRCLRGDEEALSLWETLSEAGELHISAVTYLEVVAGMHMREESITHNLLSSCICDPLDMAVAGLAGRLIVRYRAQGLTLGVPDAAIAATALAKSLTLATFNRKHFPMPELVLYPPASSI